MGRRTHESIGRTLPGRLNILITRNRDYEPATGTVCATSVEESLQIARDSGAVRAFVIGGSMIYDLFLDQADVIHWTVVSGSFQGDTFFEIDRFRTPDWELVEELMFPADAANRFDCTVSRLIRTSETRAQSATI